MNELLLNATPIGSKQADGKIRVANMPYGHDIAEGNVLRHEAWTKIGYTPTMTTADSDIWSSAGVYTFPTTPGAWEVVSTDNAADIGTSIKAGTSTGGSTTTLTDTGANFLAATAVAIGDCIVLDKSGTTPEYGYVTTVAAQTLTVAGGFSKGGTGAARAYTVIDTSATAGAQALRITYLTSLFEEKAEIFLLNGTTARVGVNADCYRVNSARVIAAGANAKPTGAITLRPSGGGTTISYITPGYTRARNIAYTVPKDKTLYVTSANFSYSTTGNANKEYARLYTRATQNEGFRTGKIFYPFTEITIQNASLQIVFSEPTKLLSGVDIKVSGIATAAGIATCSLRGWLESSV
jgi:hypothetical protein